MYLVKPWQIVKLMLTENFTWPEQTMSASHTKSTFQASRTTYFLLFHVLNLTSSQEVYGIGVILSLVLISWGSVQFWMSSLHTISDDYRYMTFAWLRKVKLMSKMCSSTDLQTLTSLFLHFIPDKENLTAVYDSQSSARRHTEKTFISS